MDLFFRTPFLVEGVFQEGWSLVPLVTLKSDVSIIDLSVSHTYMIPVHFPTCCLVHRKQITLRLAQTTFEKKVYTSCEIKRTFVTRYIFPVFPLFKLKNRQAVDKTAVKRSCERGPGFTVPAGIVLRKRVRQL